MSRHTPSITPAHRQAGYLPGEAQRNREAYRRDKGFDRPLEAISQATKDRQDAHASRLAADLLGTVTADEAFLAYELTDEMARDWVTSQPCFAHLTVNAVLMSDRLRVLAARHAMKVMQ
ncbi:hypothetical protein [Loktanella sp. R86503]|uniref:hypothetical protein n=1 Tax=Loktanella sp. R86503 TaxID=3093847 RepID=UPI0036DB158C